MSKLSVLRRWFAGSGGAEGPGSNDAKPLQNVCDSLSLPAQFKLAPGLYDCPLEPEGSAIPLQYALREGTFDVVCVVESDDLFDEGALANG